MNWEITSREHDDLEGWYERQESQRQVEGERFREVRPTPAQVHLAVKLTLIFAGLISLVCLVNAVIPVGR